MEGLPSCLPSLPIFGFPHLLECWILACHVWSSMLAYAPFILEFSELLQQWEVGLCQIPLLNLLRWFCGFCHWAHEYTVLWIWFYIYLHMNMILYIFAYAAPSLRFRNESHSVLVLFIYNTTCCYSALEKWGKEGNLYQVGESQTHLHLSSRPE